MINNIDSHQSNYNYYVYSAAIVRVNTKTYDLQIKDHSNGKWKTSKNPQLWERVQKDGELISEEDALKLEKIFNASQKNK